MVPTTLAKSLKTYREDVHRTLRGIIERGMARQSLDSSKLYIAVDLDTVIDAEMKKLESELREMSERRQELQELSKRQQFQLTDGVSTFKIIKNIRELVSDGIASAAKGQKEVLVMCSKEIVTISSVFGVIDEVKKFIERGGTFRVIADISYSMIEQVRQRMEAGEEVRHLGPYHGMLFAVIDRTTSFHAINVDIKSLSLNEPLAMLGPTIPSMRDTLSIASDCCGNKQFRQKRAYKSCLSKAFRRPTNNDLLRLSA